MKSIKLLFQKKYLLSWIWVVLFSLIRIITLIGKPVGIGRNLASWLYPFSPTLYFLAVCLIGPIIEEFIYRYFVFKMFGKKGKRFWLSCFVSFFTFILAHPRVWEDFNKYFPWLAFYAFFFIFIYWLSDWNLFFPILLHVCINTIFAIFYRWG